MGAMILVSIFICLFLLFSILHRIKKWCPRLKKHLKKRHINEENTIVLSNYTPAVKTYIPKKKVETLHIHTVSTNSSEFFPANEDFLQAGFYKIKSIRDHSPAIGTNK